MDPVCGMTVDPKTAKHSVSHQSATYYFCSAHCKAKFTAHPEEYLKAKQAAPESAAQDMREYTCPMHPEIVQQGPGTCPICGMALELKTADGDSSENPELWSMTRRLWVCAVLTAPFVIAMLLELAGVQLPLSHSIRLMAEMVLATPIVLWGGAPFFARGWKSVRTAKLNMFTLIALGTGTAYLYSVVVVLFPELIPAAMQTMGGHANVYFEAAAVITTLVVLGQVLELVARGKTSQAIRSLLQLVPTTVRKVNAQGKEETVPLVQVQVGEHLRVRPGERVPTDGILIEGISYIDESMMSGESMPVEKKTGDMVTGGTMNGTGSFILEVRHVGSDTVLAQIVKQVSDAQRTRAPIQRLADVVSLYFFPGVVFVAIGTYILWAMYGPEPRLAYALVNAVAVLIIACPCALGLATPMAIMVGMGRGAMSGILVRDAEALEQLEHIDMLVVDKTGTLTEGKPRVVSMHMFAGVSEDDLLQYAASLEQGSEHPLGSAIVQEAKLRNLAIERPDGFRAHVGKGVSGVVRKEYIVIGNQAMFSELRITLREEISIADAMRKRGETVVFVARENICIGLIGIADPIKKTTPEALQLLSASGVQIVMVTGDNELTARSVAATLGIKDVRAEIVPGHKQQIVQALQAAGHRVAMAGDGINDAPALAAATVGIAMGTGTDIAMESAAVTLMKGDLRAIARARRLSRATMRNIRQNLAFAFLYNTLGVPIAAGALYPFFGILLSPVIASIAMSLSSVSVIGNALRLKYVRL